MGMARVDASELEEAGVGVGSKMSGSTAGLPPIWVLNLRRSADRRQYVSRHLRELGLDFELIEACDGCELSREELSTLYDPAAAVRELSCELTPGAIGCALTHLRVYRRMVEEQIPCALILEDDVVIQPACIEMLRRRDRFPPDWELILLGSSSGPASFWGRRSIDAEHHIVRFAAHAWGSYGYLLKQSAARKLLGLGYPVRVPSDSWTGGATPSGVILYGVSPPAILTLSLEQAPSTMAEVSLLRAGSPTISKGLLRYFNRASLFSYMSFHKYRPLGLRRSLLSRRSLPCR